MTATGFPSSSISKKLYNLHSQGVNILDMTITNIAIISNVKRKDVQEQMSEINNYIKYLNHG